MPNDSPLYQPWREKDFASDFYVKSMTAVERWIYRTLLQVAFIGEHRPYLPDDDDLLWRLAECDNKKQWEAAKKSVKSRFQVVEQDGIRLLAHKRLLDDWNRCQERSEKMSKIGQKGGLASAQAKRTLYPSSTENAGDSKLIEEKGIEEKKENRIEDDRPTRLFKELPILLRKKLGIKPEPVEWHKEELRFLSSEYGLTRVLEAAEEFADARQGDTNIIRPIAEFLKVADGMLRGIVTFRENTELTTLHAELASILGATFDSASLTALDKIRKTYSADEIKIAAKEWIEGKDEKDVKYGLKDFAKTGCVALILVARKREVDRAKQDLTRKKIEEKLQIEAEARRQKTEQAAREAQEDLEKLLSE